MGKKRRLGDCPVCHTKVHITKQGYVAGHRVNVNDGGHWNTFMTCDGVGQRERTRVPQ